LEVQTATVTVTNQPALLAASIELLFLDLLVLLLLLARRRCGGEGIRVFLMLDSHKKGTLRLISAKECLL
jgi:hypothetical protein